MGGSECRPGAPNEQQGAMYVLKQVRAICERVWGECSTSPGHYRVYGEYSHVTDSSLI